MFLLAFLFLSIFSAESEAIIGGQSDTKLASSVVYITLSGQVTLCSGVFISEEWILTSDGCFEHGDIYVYLEQGNCEIQDKITGDGFGLIHIRNVRVQNFVPISEAKWPKKKKRRKCKIVGFGATSDSARRRSERVQSKILLVNQKCDCPSRDEDLYCTRRGEAAMCAGDVGGPVICNGKVEGILLGLLNNCTAFERCEREDTHTYIRPVFPGIKWIKQTAVDSPRQELTSGGPCLRFKWITFLLAFLCLIY